MAVIPVMGTRDVLTNGEGCLIAEETHGDFAAKINRVLSDPALRQTLSRRGPIHAARWHEDTQAARLLALYLTSMRDRRTPDAAWETGQGVTSCPSSAWPSQPSGRDSLKGAVSSGTGVKPTREQNAGSP